MHSHRPVVVRLVLAFSLLLGSLFAAGCSGQSNTPVTFTVGGTISGLAGTGLVLQDDGGNNLSMRANGSFRFPAGLASGTDYSVTVLSQPSTPAQTCVVTSGSGMVDSGNVTSVAVTCTTNSYTIGGMVSGLSGAGLVLQDNAGNNLPVSANGSFTFSAAVASGSPYSVSVLTQPSSPAQSCLVTGGSGTVAGANFAGVQVTCTTTYTISGTVVSLAGMGGGLQLQDNGTDSLLVNGNGAFTFPTPLDNGTGYAVTVSVQPSSPAQYCVVTRGTGIVTANIVNVVVDCGHREWSWMGGAKVANQAGTYGTLGTPAAGNIPGARYGSSRWTDASGNLWLFGGIGYDKTGTQAYLNDLWEYSAGQWDWIGGSAIALQAGTYGMLGQAAPGNIPGARYGSMTWTDKSGAFWLFGGVGFDSAAQFGYLSDLWKFSAGEWTWMGGPDLAFQKGTYGTEGMAAAGNVPGGRRWAASWMDASGNFWLFGGVGLDSAGTTGNLNDLWEYAGGQWTWVGGSDTANQQGSYGVEGTATAGNVPGARFASVSWTDASGNFWLFGGAGIDSSGTAGTLNDLWEYSGGQWAWKGGSSLILQQGTYGNEGTAAAGNVPGARQQAVGWTDASGNFWLFGGSGLDSTGTLGYLNDLWEYSAGRWTWMSGSSIVNPQGSYVALGAESPSNVPGGRYDPATWIDAAGNLWFVGGFGVDSAATQGYLNDVWEYRP